MNPKLIPGLVLILGGTMIFTSTVASSGADVKDFSAKQIDAIWPELWQPGSPPKVTPLSEAQVITELSGKWSVAFFGPDKTLITLKTDHQVSVGGIKEGKAWEKSGDWGVISGKLILFLREDSMPSFIFRKDGGIYIFDPWAKNLMAELQRPKPSGVQSKP